MDCFVNSSGCCQKPSKVYALAIAYSMWRNFDIYTDFRVAWDIYKKECYQAHDEIELYINETEKGEWLQYNDTCVDYQG